MEIIDEDSSVVVVVDDEDVSLEVDEVTDESGELAEQLGEDEEIAVVFDITLTRDGEEYQPENEVTVKIPCFNPNAVVYFVESDGTLTQKQTEYIDGYLVFSTKTFGRFVIAQPKAAEPQTPDEPIEEIILGDLSGDGKVDAKDRIMLTRYLAKWAGYETINEQAADLNKDGKVDAKDRIILTRHLAKWTGYETLG